MVSMVIAPNAFKECLTADAAGRALRKGLRAGAASLSVRIVPMADGGDGTTDALVAGTGGCLQRLNVTGPRGGQIQSALGWLGHAKNTAVIEMASASGLRLLKQKDQNPMHTSTYGTGELIRAAVEKGAKEILVGVGGSATVDGGAGMAAALGWRLLDRAGKPIDFQGGKDLHKIAGLDPSLFEAWRAAMRDRFGHEFSITVATDVTNPLLGEKGAAHVYGPQKGASPGEVRKLESGLENLQSLWTKKVARRKGAGAAGGLAAGLMGFCGATIRPGAQTIGEVLELEKAICQADWVLTGEGRLDKTTVCGKAPAHVAELARKHGKKLIGVGGSIAAEARPVLHRKGFDALFSICDGPMPLEDAKTHADKLLERLGRNLAPLILQ